MGWSDVIGKGDGTGKGGQDDLKIAPNTSKTIHVLLDAGEEPYSFWTHFIPEANGGKGRVAVCPGRDICPACIKGTYKTRRRHAINVYDIEEKAIKVYEAGKTVMEQLKAILDAYGSFEGIDVAIRKTGEKMNTVYGVIPIPRKEPFDKSLVANGKFALAAMKAAHTPEAINGFMSGTVTKPAAQPNTAPSTDTATATEVKVTPNSTDVDSNTFIIQFGKYKGQTMIEVAQKDLNYIKWCSENINEPAVKEAAKRAYEAFKLPHVDDNPPVEETEEKLAESIDRALEEKDPSEQESAPTDGREAVTESIYKLINNDPRYQNNFQVVVNKMKEATASPTHPNGKTLLQEYSIEELQKLEALLK